MASHCNAGETLKTVADYMTRNPHFVARDDTIVAARALMNQHHIRHLPVRTRDGLVGVVTDRDLQLFEGDPKRARRLLVADVMTPFAFTVPPETPLAEVARRMAESRYGCVLVADKTAVLGIFTAYDALRALTELSA